MNLLLLVIGEWISFISQARYLQSALDAQGVKAEVLFVPEKIPDLSAYKDYLVIPIGSWQHFDSIIAPPLALGCKTIPWLVSDERVDPKIAAKLNRLPLVLTTSNYCRGKFIESGVVPERIKVLYEAVDEDLWHPFSDGENADFMSYMNVENDAGVHLSPSWDLVKAKSRNVPILLTIGGDAGSKGGVEIMKALSGLPKELQWLYIIKTIQITPGQTNIRQIEKEVIDASYGIASRMRFISGEFSAKFILGLMNLCDIYIATSRTEGFGLPLVEAQMCGKMVITHRANSNPETITENETGLLVECHTDKNGISRADIPGLTKTLATVLSDHDLRKRLSGNARPAAVKRFGKKVIADQLITFAQDYLR